MDLVVVPSGSVVHPELDHPNGTGPPDEADADADAVVAPRGVREIADVSEAALCSPEHGVRRVLWIRHRRPVASELERIALLLERTGASLEACLELDVRRVRGQAGREVRGVAAPPVRNRVG